METYFTSVNVSKRHFVVLGQTTDQFYPYTTTPISLEEMLHKHLRKLEYQRIVFYSPNQMLYCWDEGSFNLTQDYNENNQATSYSSQHKERLLKVGPLTSRVPNLPVTQKDSSNSTNKAKWNLGKMNSAGVIKRLDKYMTDTKVKTALVITDTENFLTYFREIYGEKGRMDISRDIQATLSSWDRTRHYGDKNIVVWIFQKSNSNTLMERLSSNDIWLRFFFPMFVEKMERREGTLIDIPIAGAGEIKNLLMHHNIKNSVPINMRYIDDAARELEKLARGQTAFQEENHGTLNMNGLSALIMDSLDSSIKCAGNGINEEYIATICGKTERVSPFDKIRELAGMNDFKQYIDELQNIVSITGIYKEPLITYKDRLTPPPKAEWKETFNFHISLVGNPGTGKSTVAKFMGEVFYELGLLPIGHVIKVTREDLVAGYVGQTAIKTKERINEAIGGVLFIDEAYTLARGGENDYGQEAIDTIVEAMTDRMGEFAVIIAGYPGEIETLLRKNPGFKSRFVKRIRIEDYTAKELADIFIKDVSKNGQGIVIGNELKNVLEVFMQRYYDGTPKGKEGEWANARTIINLSKEMRDKCKYLKENTLSIEHIPYELKKYLDDSTLNRFLPKTLTFSQVRLPQLDIRKNDGNIDVAKMENAVLFIENKKTNGTVTFGTGFLISPNGHFITCDHVIKDADKILARVRINTNGVYDDKIYECNQMNTFEDLDIALLKLEGLNLPYLSLESDLFYDFKKGSKVCLSGYPFGDRTSHDCSYVEGKISSARTESDFECINIDISGLCGNSGGAVLDTETRKVVGVFVGSINEGNEAINYMRPIRHFWNHFVK